MSFKYKGDREFEVARISDRDSHKTSLGNSQRVNLSQPNHHRRTSYKGTMVMKRKKDVNAICTDDVEMAQLTNGQGKQMEGRGTLLMAESVRM